MEECKNRKGPLRQLDHLIFAYPDIQLTYLRKVGAEAAVAVLGEATLTLPGVHKHFSTCSRIPTRIMSHSLEQEELIYRIFTVCT